ncbi:MULTISPECIES: cation transporter dimerization domain-containing protein [Pseudofrankia]|uniref:cation transporter dimerization domain-containing protein n=1 Tax=Pseudofrankia TaxID=2994363 RepID=UPI000234B574|nr:MULTISPECIES: hypothetical protein [Pseudofrankia]OHV35181.1 hypothetical protein BCD49_04165 [Pseudofrankia sp. EUN1h]
MVQDVLADDVQVVEVHDLHAWEITSGQPALSAHVLVVPGGDCHHVRRVLQGVLREEHRISHATLQVDHLGEDQDTGLLQITTPETAQADHARREDSHGPVHYPASHPH